MQDRAIGHGDSHLVIVAGNAISNADKNADK